jgi:hypothetical protein
LPARTTSNETSTTQSRFSISHSLQRDLIRKLPAWIWAIPPVADSSACLLHYTTCLCRCPLFKAFELPDNTLLPTIRGTATLEGRALATHPAGESVSNRSSSRCPNDIARPAVHPGGLSSVVFQVLSPTVHLVVSQSQLQQILANPSDCPLISPIVWTPPRRAPDLLIFRGLTW